MADQPTGTVTLLFTDIEGSTRLLERLGRDRYAEALELHRRLLREAFERHGGYEVDEEGDALFVAFATAADAVEAAAEAQQALEDATWPDGGAIRVRMGIHTGEPLAVPPKYVGLDVHRAARIMAAGHGGQVLVSQATRDLLGEAGLRDLGEHRLKDLGAPERLYQLSDGDFPPLKTLHRTNLPVQPTPLIGRERELSEVMELVRSHRLVTLTGAGGSGKTRLALQAAAELVEEFPEGVWFVSLAGLTDPALLEPTTASALGATVDLASFLRGKRLLLVLDNLEQLLPGVAPLVAEVDAQVIATSRERLNVYGEQEYQVPTLSPDAASALFTERARLLKPSFEPDEYVAAIARRVDGLPLALELAAARVKVLTTQQISERLERSLTLLVGGARDAPERQRTLRAAIAWSYELLTDEERSVFERLAVFSGSFDLEAAEAVGADLESLSSLVDKSLLRQTHDGRFFFLETIKEYAAERLESRSDRESVRARHAELMLSRAALSTDPPEQEALAWSSNVERDHADYREALEWLHTKSDDRLLLLASRLARFWDARHYLAEGRHWLDVALAASPPEPTAERLEALVRRAHIAWRRGDSDFGDVTEAAEAAAQEVGDVVSIAWLHSIRGAQAAYCEDLETARREYERALELLTETGAVRLIAIMKHDLGLLAWHEGDLDRARSLIEEALQLCQAESLPAHEAGFLSTLGQLTLETGDYEGAETLLRRSIEVNVAANAGGVGVLESLVGLALTGARRGEYEEACVLLGAYEAYMASTGEVEDPRLDRLRAELRADAEARLGPSTSQAAYARGQSLSLREALERAVARK